MIKNGQNVSKQLAKKRAKQDITDSQALKRQDNTRYFKNQVKNVTTNVKGSETKVTPNTGTTW